VNRLTPHGTRTARWLVLTGIALFAALLLLAACNDDKRDTSSGDGSNAAVQASSGAAAAKVLPSPTPFEAVGNLVLWHSWAGADADALTAILTRLKQQAPLLNVETLFVAPNDMPQAYADAVAAGGGPDLAVTENWWINGLTDAQTLRPLNDLLYAGQADEYYPAAQQNFLRNGVLYGLPATFELVSLFYNRALAGSTPLPATTDALAATAALSPSLGVGLYSNLYHLWWGFPAYGAQLFDETGKVILDQNSGAADYLTWMSTISNTTGSYVDIDYGMLLDRFKKGEFAWFVDGPWATAELREALGDNLALGLLPAGPYGPAQPWLSAEGVILNPSLSPDRAALAFYLATQLTNADAGTAFAGAQRLPANKGATLPDDPIVRGFVQQAATAAAAPAQGEMENVWGYGGDMIGKVMGGSLSPGQAVRDTTALINDLAAGEP
jgi:maltose-binding protein MalE